MCTFSCLWICSETFLPRAPQAILWWAPSPSSFYFSQRCHSQTQLLKNCIQFTEWVWDPVFSCMRKELCSLSIFRFSSKVKFMRNFPFHSIYLCLRTKEKVITGPFVSAFWSVFYQRGTCNQSQPCQAPLHFRWHIPCKWQVEPCFKFCFLPSRWEDAKLTATLK